MQEFSATVSIESPPERIWAVLCDVERWPEWTASMKNVQRLDGGPLAVGSKARVEQPGLRPAVWEVTELEEGRNFTWVTRAPGATIAGVHIIEPDRNGSSVTLSIRISGVLAPLARWIYGRRIREYVGMEAEGLRRRCASRSTPGR